jgi:hypothetical protein
MFLFVEINWSKVSEDIVLLLFEDTVDYAGHHGVCKLDEKVNILYKMEAYFKITNNE